MGFKPLHDRIAVRRVAQDEKTAGGIIIPDTAQEKPSEGVVISVGSGARGKDGTIVPLEVKAGDKVLFQKTKNNDAIVTAIYPRDSELKRQDKLIAANIDQLWLVVAIEPHYEFELIDRYLIMAENSNLPIGIIVNKIELSGRESKTENDFLNYQSLGYDVHFLSVKKQINLDFFKEQLINKSHIFLGQSGVGKSSLINSLIPDLQLRVNEISSKSKLGKHTTTNTTIYHIPSGGDLIDSPGVREFQLDSLTELEI